VIKDKATIDQYRLDFSMPKMAIGMTFVLYTDHQAAIAALVEALREMVEQFWGLGIVVGKPPNSVAKAKALLERVDK
jgi:hypothetical protein